MILLIILFTICFTSLCVYIMTYPRKNNRNHYNISKTNEYRDTGLVYYDDYISHHDDCCNHDHCDVSGDCDISGD